MSESPNVFLSWSGPRSKAMASALNEWLPDVVQSVVPFFSDEIETGAFWDDALKSSLKAVRFAVICCTPENITAPWLNYEAGALAERMAGGTAPWLLDSRPEALKVSPLSRLMARTTDKAGTFALLQTLNASLERGSLSIASLTKAFERLWEDLEKKLKAIPEPTTKIPERTDRDMLEEVVGLCRKIANDGLLASGRRSKSSSPVSKFALVDRAVREATNMHGGDWPTENRVNLLNQLMRWVERRHGKGLPVSESEALDFAKVAAAEEWKKRREVSKQGPALK